MKIGMRRAMDGPPVIAIKRPRAREQDCPGTGMNGGFIVMSHSLAIDDARAGAQAPESLDDQREAHQPQSVGLNFQNMDVNRHRSVDSWVAAQYLASAKLPPPQDTAA